MNNYESRALFLKPSLLVIIASSLFCLRTASAQTHSLETVKEVEMSSETSRANQHDHADDPWFFYFSAGIGHPNYDDDIQSRIDYQKSQGGSSPEAGFVDLPGIYHRIRPGLVAGIILNMSFENVSGDFRQTNSFSVQTFNPALSFFYFPQSQTGKGWFLRGDLGESRIMQLRESNPTHAFIYHDKRIDDGLFSQVAFGYGFPATHYARLLLHLNAFRSSAGGHSATGLSFNIGFFL